MNDEDEEEEKANHRSSDEETAEGSSSNTNCDQDSENFFMKDTNEEVDTAEIEEEAEIMRWRLTMRIASLPDERWAKKAMGRRNKRLPQARGN